MISFLCVRNCRVVNTGTRSYQSAVQVEFQITAIKFKVNENLKVQVDWNTVGENLETNELLNFNLFKLIPKKRTYTHFNQCITKSSQMNFITNKQKNKVRFHHSRDIILPLIETRDRILTQYLTLGIDKGDTSYTKQ